MEATAIVKGTDKLDAAKVLADWSVSEAANQLYAEGYAVVAIPELAQPIAHMPEDLKSKMIDNDFDWAAATASGSSPNGSRYDCRVRAEEVRLELRAQRGAALRFDRAELDDSSAAVAPWSARPDHD